MKQSVWKVFVNCEVLCTCRPVLAANARACLLFQRRVQDVISPIVFEAAYSLGEHVTGQEEREMPALTPVLRWRKGQKIAQKNQVRTLKLSAGTQGGRSLWQKLWPCLPGHSPSLRLPSLICRMSQYMIWGLACKNYMI